MASIRTIYLSEEINNKLKTVDNISKLITHLLEKHFQIEDKDISELSLEEIEEKTIRLRESLTDPKLTIEEMQKNAEELDLYEEKKKVLTFDTKEEEKKRIEKEKVVLQDIKDWFLGFFEITETEAMKYAERYNQKRKEGETSTVFEFGKGLGLKERKEE